MSDFLLVHDAGHGSWCWGRVWGHLTAPQEHPPRLYARDRVGKVASLDLPGHPGSTTNSTSSLSFETFVSAVTDEVTSQGLRDLVMVGHGVSAPVLLQAAAQLEEPPKRVVLLAGAIPDDGKCPLDIMARTHRLGFKMMSRKLNGKTKAAVRMPKPVIDNVYCNGMRPFDAIQIVGRFVPLPVPMFSTKVRLSQISLDCPVTYVVLWRDKLLPAALQRRMASRIRGAEVAAEIDSCHEAMIERPKQVADVLLRYA